MKQVNTNFGDNSRKLLDFIRKIYFFLNWNYVRKIGAFLIREGEGGVKRLFKNGNSLSVIKLEKETMRFGYCVSLLK